MLLFTFKTFSQKYFWINLLEYLCRHLVGEVIIYSAYQLVTVVLIIVEEEDELY